MKEINRGFTLIELLVVVLIIGILAAVALPQYNKAVMKSRATEIASFISTVEKAMSVYMLEHDGYPSSNVETNIPWDELNIDITTYCQEKPESPHYTCALKLSQANSSAVSINSDFWKFSINADPSSRSGPFYIYVTHNNDNTVEKKFTFDGASLKAKPLADLLVQNDPTWIIELPSGM